jgi:hypothetical protein
MGETRSMDDIYLNYKQRFGMAIKGRDTWKTKAQTG